MSNSQVLWQQYIDVMIGQKCAQSMIINRKDATPWASSANFVLKSYKGNELKEDGSEAVVDIDEEEGFIEIGKTREKPKFGFRVNEQKYQLLRKSEDGNTFYLKCKGGGAAVCMTERAIIVGTWVENTAATNVACHQIVEEVGKHLKEHKF
jgi:hypothetical protein